MLEEKIDKAANGIKTGIGWIREHKKKIIGGALVGIGSVAGIGLAYKIGQASDDDEYLCLEESDIEVTDIDDDEEPDIEVDVDVTVTELEETED